MKMFRLFIKNLLILSLLLFVVAGCDNLFVKERSCGFSFDMRFDDQHAAVLDYKLWGEKNLIDGVPKEYLDKRMKFYGEGIGFQYDRPISLYVKWQGDITGSIYEKTVDLRHVMPRNLEGTDLYFIVHGPQIYVYLALKESYVRGAQRIGTRYLDRTNIQLYPNPSK
ncbi:hypothetical protein [Solimicrobium silvestre]|uniref:Lipoprotein n=1 Tax=Solimicrobium silvestre TaxID=2099400 RepID=A0A2S9GT22_9BURK|nr:hypothetical protein [Solimicrobium silvestre]PRC90838.1 hypothetical protein S2091_4419 [Solimicrobium silvestre]